MKGIVFVEDEVLSDWDRALLLHLSLYFLCVVFREADSAPRNARVLPAESPSRVFVCVRVGVIALSLTGCNPFHMIRYIYTFVLFQSVAVSVYRCVCEARPLSFLLLLLFGYSSVHDPRGPALFYTHAHNNATPCHP